MELWFDLFTYLAPKGGWPQEKAFKAAAGASDHLHQIQVFDTLAQAVADLQVLFATTVRNRDLVKPVYALEPGIAALATHTQQGVQTGILFGTERTGLSSDEVSLCQAILTIPLNPLYTSLNIAQAVLLVAYTWWRNHQTSEETLPPLSKQDEPLVTHGDFQGFLEHLEKALDLSGFLHPPLMRPHMLRNLRALFGRISLTAQEVRTLRGMLTSFERLARPSTLADKGPPDSL